MPLFEGHKAGGLQRLFIEMPDDAKDHIVWKWPDQQIIQHSQLNVDLDYQAVFTNLGKVIGVLGPGRHQLDEGASLVLGWLVDHLTDNAYYDAEVYFVTTRETPNVQFGGPVDNLTDGPSGLVVTVRVFGELAFKVTDPAALLAKLTGTGADGDHNSEISAWVTDQTLAAIRAVLPDIVAEHGVLAMGQLQDATAHGALAKANETLTDYGLAVSAFGELNVNVPEDDARQLKQLAATKAYSAISGSFDSAVRGEAALEIANGIAQGNVGAQPGIMAGVVMGLPVAPGAQPPLAGVGAPPVASAPSAAPAGAVQAEAAPAGATATAAAGAGGAGAQAAGAHFCAQCGTAISPGSHFCPNCGAAVAPAAS